MTTDNKMLDFTLTPAKESENVSIIRLQTSFWRDSRGVYSRKSLTYLRRKSKGYHALEEECGAVGAEDAMNAIINLDECGDGIYEAIVCNISHDYESGHIDGWDLKLVKVIDQ